MTYRVHTDLYLYHMILYMHKIIYTPKVRIATPSQINVFVFLYGDTLISKETPSEEDWLEVLRPNELPCDILSGSTRVTKMFHNRPLQDDGWQCSRSRLKISVEVGLAYFNMKSVIYLGILSIWDSIWIQCCCHLSSI